VREPRGCELPCGYAPAVARDPWISGRVEKDERTSGAHAGIREPAGKVTLAAARRIYLICHSTSWSEGEDLVGGGGRGPWARASLLVDGWPGAGMGRMGQGCGERGLRANHLVTSCVAPGRAGNQSVLRAHGM
jgi:hypothetical protein